AAVMASAVFTAGGSAGGTGAFIHYSLLATSSILGFSYGYRQSTYSLIPTYAGEFPIGAGLGSVGPAALSSATHRVLNAESEPTFLLVELGIPGLLVARAPMPRVLLLTIRIRAFRSPDV